MNLKKVGKVVTSKFVGTRPSSYKKKNLPGHGLTKVEKHWLKEHNIKNALIELKCVIYIFHIQCHKLLSSMSTLLN